jgi:hypothetical protein
MSEIKNGDPVETFIIQVAALSSAATQVPEITVAIQEFSECRISQCRPSGAFVHDRESSSRYKGRRGSEFQEFVPMRAFTRHRYHWQSKPREGPKPMVEDPALLRRRPMTRRATLTNLFPYFIDK